MQAFTLKFTNQELEDKYQQFTNEQQKSTILIYCRWYVLACTIGAIVSVVQGMYYISIYYLITTLSCGVIHKCEKYIPAMYLIALYNCSFPASISVVVVTFMLQTQQPQDIIHLVAVLIFFANISIITENLIIAMLQMFLYMMACVAVLNIYLVFNSVMQIAWMQLIVLWVYQYYNKIKQKKELFQQSQVNESIYHLIKDTTKEDFSIFSFDKVQNHFVQELSNISLDIQHRLDNFFIRKELSLSNYIFRKFIKEKQTSASSKEEIQGFQDNMTKSRNYFLYVQNYPKQKFYLRFSDSVQMSYHPNYQVKLVNKFFHSISKLRKNGLKDIRYILQLINEFSCKTSLHYLISNSHDLRNEHSTINLRNLLLHCCKETLLDVFIKGNSELEINVQILSAYLKSILSIIRRFNSALEIEITVYRIDLKIKFQFKNQIRNLDIIKESYFYQMLELINQMLSFEELTMHETFIETLVVRYAEKPFLNMNM